MASAFVRRATKGYVRYRNAGWFLSGPDSDCRRELLTKFRRIESYVKCSHAEGEILRMADFLLRTHVDGSMVECGCYHGGSTAKLSLIARVTGKRLYVCDSFQGLPPVDEGDGSYSSTYGERSHFKQGDYAVGLVDVRNNVSRYGDISCCEFVEGFFSQSLPNLSISPCFVFMDVDLISSARDVIRHLWPTLRSGGRFFTHEGSHPEFIRGIMDAGYWQESVGHPPPTIFGAGYGCGFGAGDLAYFDKCASTCAPRVQYAGG